MSVLSNLEEVPCFILTIPAGLRKPYEVPNILTTKLFFVLRLEKEVGNNFAVVNCYRT